MIQECGERFLQPAGKLLVALGQGVPCLDTWITRRKLCALGDHTRLDLTVKPTLADDIPTLVVTTLVLVEVCLGCLVRGMGCPKRNIGEERPIRSNTLAVAEHQQQLIDHVFAQVVPLFSRSRWFGLVIVDHQLRVKLVGLTFEESVETIEASGQRPLVERASGGDVLGRRQVPLPHAVGAVSLGLEHFGNRGRMV